MQCALPLVIAGFLVARISNANLLIYMPAPPPTTAMDATMLSRKTTTLQHGPSITTCPCYEPSKVDCGIKAFTTWKTSDNCPVPTRVCPGGLPRCKFFEFTRYLDRCPQQIHTATVTKTYRPTCTSLYGCPEDRTITSSGIGPIQMVVIATSI